jgi:predicted phosphate transport protein (TIGR00153 family)
MKSIVSRLLPKDTPIQLMIDHVKVIADVSKVMEELVTKYLDHKDISELVTFIAEKENDADDIKMNLRKLLERNVKVPFSKRELIYAMHLQDDIIDMMKDIAKKMSLNELDFDLDKKVREDFLQLVQEAMKAIEHLGDEISQLKKVMASAFAKRFRKKEEREIDKIEALEHKVDKLTLKLGKWSYSQKNVLNPVDLIFFNELVMIFADISDVAENLAQMIRSFTR